MVSYESNDRLVPPSGQDVSGHEAIREGPQGFLATQVQVAVDVTNKVQARDTAHLRVQWQFADNDAKPLAIGGTTGEVVRRRFDRR